ncbi:MAG: GNAT family N-acetyltransferase [Dysgonomonas mossii]|uniref:GNAT family N-acetyltransferase n=1 Tax=Dysgonomonas mossii TaxID=163665 RepID=UPI001E0BD0AB|nr:GNAT family N-acetyltransferase [Dysgonomonas mossii]MBS5798083.1 GNAT family N-acetyltransferase [Dysgonomonas mossii]MBS7112591.1 GNAT family N-acetyltransferase [Dysgonomonas mossii]
MIPFNIQIEKLQKNDIKKASAMLADTFASNPAYALIFTKKDKLRDGLFWLFKANLFLLNQKISVTNVIKEKESGNIIGVYSLLPPGGVKSELKNYLQIGLPQFILKFGFRTLQKMLGMDSYNKQLLTKAINTDKYYYLSMVAVKEESRGTGIGSIMIKHCIDELRTEERKGQIVGLTTQLPENVTFYTRLGFQKLDEGEVQYKQDSYYNYNMKLNL